MDCGRNYVDISRWMLFEATGDSSEVDSDRSCTVGANGDVGKLISSSTSSGDVGEYIRLRTAASLAEDDAFSCSCDCNNSNNCCKNFDDSYVCFDDGNETDDDEQARLRDDQYDRQGREYNEVDDEDEDAVDQVRKGAALKGINSRQPEPLPGEGGGEAVGVMMMNMMELAEAGRRQKKPKACGKPAELINQRDTDRLFWEACLSS